MCTYATKYLVSSSAFHNVLLRAINRNEAVAQTEKRKARPVGKPFMPESGRCQWIILPSLS